jgi:hypothetical protein
MVRERVHVLRRTLRAIVPSLLAIGLLLAVTSPADAATITVTGTSESTAADGECTLPEALVNAQFDTPAHQDCPAGEGGGIVDTIAFNIPATQCPGGVCTISLSATYPLFGPLTIDGYTQPGASSNTLAVGTNAVLRIVLRRQGAGDTTALTIALDDVTVRGLAISDYTGVGIRIDGGARARIIGCFIGTDVTGAVDRGIGDGIWVMAPATDVRIGGASPADRNLISGNNFFGILLQGPNAVIQGNAIGTNAAGTAGLPNGTGIGTGASSVDNATIGGVSPGEGNVVAYNSNAGIDIYAGLGNRILGNAIFSNALLGIDLRKSDLGAGAGVTPNDPGDADTGANNLQNFPVLTSAGVRVNTTIHGTLNSTPFFDYRIEFFSNTACDGSGNGEGETFIGFVNVTADELGNASFVGVFPPVLAGRSITATATALLTNNTSEFSACLVTRQAEVRATNFTGQQITSLTTTEANQGGAVFTQFQLGLSSIPTANVTVPISVSDSTEGTIVFPASPMTFVPGNFGTVQQVRIVGVDDGIDDGDMPYAFVIGPASSADPNYNGLDSADIPVTNLDNDDRFGAMCRPRPPVRVSVAKIGGGQLRATVTIGVNPNTGTQNELVAITWTRFDTATVALDGVGPVQVGQASSFPTPLTQSASFVITRTPGATSGTVRLVITDGCGDWPTFVGGGSLAW